MKEPVTFAIIGGGTAGWMSAALLSRFSENGYKVILVESEDIGTVGVGEATIPQINLFNTALGIDEDAFVRETQGTFKLGIEFVDWHRKGAAYMHAFGAVGRDIGIVPFQHYWHRARSLGKAKELRHYALNEIAALGGRMQRGPLRTTDRLGDMPYAFHFDAGLYAAYLRRYAEARGTQRVEGKITTADLDPETGHVTCVRLEGGQSVSADYFIDCSGFRGLLIEEALKTGYDDWTHWLPCNRALAVPCAHGGGEITPYTRSTAREAGWQWRIPLQHRIGNGLVYASELMSDEEAAETLLAGLDSAPVADPRPVKFTPGRRIKAWSGNVVAIGLSGGFLEPLESTSIHLIQTAAHRLLALFPARGFRQADIDEFNLQTRLEYEDIRDFIIAHYKVTRRCGEPFWDYVREMDIPATLAHRIDLFKSSARFFGHSKLELFAEESWVQVLIGQGLQPAVDPVTRFVGDRELESFLADIAGTIAQTASGFPDHAEFLARLPERETSLKGTIGTPLKRG